MGNVPVRLVAEEIAAAIQANPPKLSDRARIGEIAPHIWSRITALIHKSDFRKICGLSRVREC
jgi:hypothetical protein